MQIMLCHWIMNLNNNPKQGKNLLVEWHFAPAPILSALVAILGIEYWKAKQMCSEVSLNHAIKVKIREIFVVSPSKQRKATTWKAWFNWIIEKRTQTDRKTYFLLRLTKPKSNNCAQFSLNYSVSNFSNDSGKLNESHCIKNNVGNGWLDWIYWNAATIGLLWGVQ